uniref:Uncharacterized protein n=1 Tax=Cuerna arida TaxID=1464854 RepID=A0A1B6H411_9HEMI
MDEETCDNLQDLSSVSDNFLSKITVRTKPVKTKKVLHNIEENSQVENHEEMEVMNKSTVETSKIERLGKKQKRRNTIAICSISQSKKEKDPFYDIKLVKKQKPKRKTYDGYQNEPDLKYSFEGNDKIEDDLNNSEYLQDEHLNFVDSFEEKVENEANSEIDSPTIHHKKKHKLKQKHSENSQSETPILENKHAIESNAESKSESPTVKHHKKPKLKSKYSEDRHLNLENNFKEKYDTENNVEIGSPTVKRKNKHKLEQKHSQDFQSGNFIFEDKHERKSNAEIEIDSPTMKHHKKLRVNSKYSEHSKGIHLNFDNNFEEKDENDNNSEIDSPTAQHKNKHKLKQKHSQDFQSKHLIFEDKYESESYPESNNDSPTVKHPKKPNLKRKHSGYLRDGLINIEGNFKETDENYVNTDTKNYSPTAKHKNTHKLIQKHSVGTQNIKGHLSKHKSKKKKVHDLNNINCSMVPKENDSKHKLLEDDNEMKCSSNSVISSSLILQNILKSEREALYRKRHSISKKKRKTKQQKISEIRNSISDQSKNKLQQKESPEFFPEQSSRKEIRNKKNKKHNTNSITSRNREKGIFRDDSNEIEIMRDILLKKAMENTKNIKTKASVECTTKKEDKHKESSSEVKKSNVLGKNKQREHKEGKNKCIQIKGNKMDMQHIQQSLLDKALKTINSETENSKGSIKSKSSKIKSKDKNNLKIKRIKNKDKPIVVKDPKVETGCKKKKKKAKTKDELEEMTSKLLSAALTSKSR